MERFKANMVIGLVRLTGCLSLSHIQKLGTFVGRCLWLFNTESAQVTRKNLKLCYPELSEQEVNTWTKISLQETGKVALEMGMVWEWPVDKSLALIKHIEGKDLIDQAIANGKGVIMLAPHLGNWELAGLYSSSQFSMAALYRPPRLKLLEDYMSAVRGRCGSELVPTNKRGVLRLFKILKTGGVVGILPDQEPPFSGGVFAPFFGVNANTMKLVSKLVEKTQPEVVCVWTERLADANGFVLHITKADSEIYSDELETSVAALNRSVEKCIRTIPLQYQWEYKRFRRRPKDEGLPHFYDE